MFFSFIYEYYLDMKNLICFLAVLLCILFNDGMVTAQKIVFSPQWTPQAQFAGYYMALEKGFYKEAGLDVEIVHPLTSTSESVYTRLVEHKSDIIMLQLMQAVLYNTPQHEMVNIMQTSQNNCLLFVMQPEYTDISQIDHPKVACWKSGFGELAKCLEYKNHYNFEWIYFTSGINIFISHAVDAIIAMEYNEYFLLLNCGKKIAEKNTFRFSEKVGNIPEDGLYCLSDAYKERKTEFDLFAKMSAKGWEYARSHPQETLEVVIQWMKKENIPYSIVHQQWMLKTILDAQIDKELGKATYQLTQDDYLFLQDILKKTQQPFYLIDYSRFCVHQ